MRLLINWINAFINILSVFLENTVAFLLAVFSVVIFLQVLTRFVIKMPLPWTEELSRYLFIWMVFLGSALGVRKALHYRIVMATQIIPDKIKSFSELIVHLFIFCFFFLVLINSLDFLQTIKINRSPVLQWSMGIPYSSVVAFGLFGIIFSAEAFVRNIFEIATSLKNKSSVLGET